MAFHLWVNVGKPFGGVSWELGPECLGAAAGFLHPMLTLGARALRVAWTQSEYFMVKT